MAKKLVLVSDLSGEDIPDGRGAEVRITFKDSRTPSVVMDVTTDEAKALGVKGRTVARRGRKPATAGR